MKSQSSLANTVDLFLEMGLEFETSFCETIDVCIYSHDSDYWTSMMFNYEGGFIDVF